MTDVIINGEPIPTHHLVAERLDAQLDQLLSLGIENSNLQARLKELENYEALAKHYEACATASEANFTRLDKEVGREVRLRGEAQNRADHYREALEHLVLYRDTLTAEEMAAYASRKLKDRPND